MRWKNAALLALAVTVVGCSSNSKKELPPAELPEFTTEVQLKTEWSRSVGDGQGEGYNLLTPAVDGDHIYAADVEGVVMAMFLFLLINQLRAENHAHVQRIAGGPLILDNPFAKATSPAMWRACSNRLLTAAGLA